MSNYAFIRKLVQVGSSHRGHVSLLKILLVVLLFQLVLLKFILQVLLIFFVESACELAVLDIRLVDQQ